MKKTENALQKPSFKDILKQHKTSVIQYAGFFLVLIIFSVITGGQIFSAYNIKTLIGQTAPLMITCVGVIFMFTNGSMDIASGAVGGLCAMSAALVLNATGSLPLAILVSVAISVFLYLFSAFVSIKFGLISTIASLAVMFMARGIVTYVCSLMPSTVISLDNYGLVNAFKNNTALQIALMAAVGLICWVMFSFTKLGKHARAVGDNPISAEQNGVKINKTKMLCALISGFCVGIVAIFLLARAGSVSKNIGSGMEMDVMVAMILGGMALSGGSKSKFSAAVIGPLTFRLLSNGMTMAGVPTGYVSLIRGIIFLIIVFATL
ncbi:MAG: ABC transporter permease, partial [Eubacteriales bacterium]